MYDHKNIARTICRSGLIGLLPNDELAIMIDLPKDRDASEFETFQFLAIRFSFLVSFIKEQIEKNSFRRSDPGESFRKSPMTAAWITDSVWLDEENFVHFRCRNTEHNTTYVCIGLPALKIVIEEFEKIDLNTFYVNLIEIEKQ